MLFLSWLFGTGYKRAASRFKIEPTHLNMHSTHLTKEVRGPLNEAAVIRSLLFFAILGAWSVSEETRAVEKSWLLKSGGKYFPDSLMIGLCQITNWISSHWRRLHFLGPRLHHRVQIPLNRDRDRLSTRQLGKSQLHLQCEVFKLLTGRRLTCIVAVGWAGSAPTCWCSSVWRWARPGKGCWWTPWWCPWGTTRSCLPWSSQCTWGRQPNEWVTS